jgi:hypothetical protein
MDCPGPGDHNFHACSGFELGRIEILVACSFKDCPVLHKCFLLTLSIPSLSKLMLSQCATLGKGP